MTSDQKVQKPEDFKFSDNKCLINLSATGLEDGETTSCDTQIEMHCEPEFAIGVIHNLFDQDAELEELFSGVVMQRKMAKMMNNPIFNKYSEELNTLKEESEKA